MIFSNYNQTTANFILILRSTLGFLTFCLNCETIFSHNYKKHHGQNGQKKFSVVKKYVALVKKILPWSTKSCIGQKKICPGQKKFALVKKKFALVKKVKIFWSKKLKYFGQKKILPSYHPPILPVL